MSGGIALLYRGFYFFIVSIIIIILYKVSRSSISLLEAPGYLLRMGLLTLGGLPPFLGFFPKFLVLRSVRFLFPFLRVVLVRGALLALLYYLALFLNVVYLSPSLAKKGGF